MTRASRWSPGIIDAGTWTSRSTALEALSGAAIGHMYVVVPADSVGAIEMTMPDRVSQLDVRRIGDDRLVVRLKLWTVPSRYEQPRRTEKFKEYLLEFPPEDHIDDEVDAAVDGH